jgi:hypothetical protein
MFPSGSLPADDTPLLDVLPPTATPAAGAGKGGSNASSSTPLPSVSLQLATLYTSAVAAGAAPSGGQPVQGVGRLMGVMESVTYAHKRDPWSRVVADLRVGANVA